MATFDFSIRRRDLAWALALVMVVTAVWAIRSDPAAGGQEATAFGIDLVYVTVGTNYPDALGSGPGAAIGGAPVILVPTNPPLDPVTSAELVRLKPRKVVIIGGTAAVSQATQDAIEAILPWDTIVVRLTGSNRYVTNTLLTQSVFPAYGWVAIPAAGFTVHLPNVMDVVLTSEFIFNNNGDLFAPVNFPDGSLVVGIDLSGWDSADGPDVSATLIRISKEGGGIDVLVTVSSFDDTGEFFVGADAGQNTFQIRRVDNENYAYTVIVNGAHAEDRKLRSVHLKYRLGTSGL